MRATDASIVAITVDDSEDISRKEQKSICIRYTHLPSLPVHEDDAQLQLKHMIDVDAKSLSGAILSSLAALGLGSCIIVAQCYDGAAVMSGRVIGLQAHIRQLHESAIYTSIAICSQVESCNCRCSSRSSVC